MKLQNKKTGEIAELGYIASSDGYIILQDVNTEEFICKYGSLAALNDEWEDYKKPKEHWCITMYGGITRIRDDEEPIDDLIEIGNYFNSKEDAYDALDQLKAFKRLKDKGFRFVEHQIHGMTENGEGDGCAYFEFDKQLEKLDLNLVFGDE